MLFYILASAIILSALFVILSKNPVISALWLIVCLFIQAALFVTLGAHLVAALQILLYAGAIMVLILFVVMLLNLSPKNLKWKAVAGERIILGSAVVYFMGVIGTALFIAFRRGGGVFGDTSGAAADGTIEAVGYILLSKYAVPFELLSVLLLVAIVGAVVAVRRHP